MTDALSTPNLDKLQEKFSVNCPAIRNALQRSAEMRARLAEVAIPSEGLQADTAFVVFGSLARGEWTIGSPENGKKGSDLD